MHDTRTATLAEGFYLANMTLLPGLGFLALLLLWLRHRNSDNAFARLHLAQTLRASLLGGVIAGSIALTATLTGSWMHPSSWYAVEAYFIIVHSPLTVFGMIGLAKAMAGQPWRYPVIGPRMS